MLNGVCEIMNHGPKYLKRWKFIPDVGRCRLSVDVKLFDMCSCASVFLCCSYAEIFVCVNAFCAYTNSHFILTICHTKSHFCGWRSKMCRQKECHESASSKHERNASILTRDVMREIPLLPWGSPLRTMTDPSLTNHYGSLSYAFLSFLGKSPLRTIRKKPVTDPYSGHMEARSLIWLLFNQQLFGHVFEQS